jgi:hypothetical protein
MIEKFTKSELQLMDGTDGRRKNPRRATDDDLTQLIENIKADIGFLEARPGLVSRETATGKLFLYAGHKRLEACEAIGIQLPCYVENDVPISVQEARCLKDNDHAGRWDIEEIRSGWAGRTEGMWTFSGIAFKQADEVEELESEKDRVKKAYETYISNDERQIVLYFNTDDYKKFTEAFYAYKASAQIADNGDALLSILGIKKSEHD